MNSKDFIAYKQSEGQDVVSVSGSESDIAKGVLDPLLPLAPLDVFQMDVSKDFDLALLHEKITFTNEPFPSGQDFAFETIDNQSEDSVYHELYSYEGEIFRRAVVRQGGKLWQVVGYETKDGVITTLQEGLDRAWSEREIFGGDQIASYTWHNDGGGPVSWDGYHTIYAVANYWIYSEGGDIDEDNNCVKLPEDPVSRLVAWLDSVNAQALFLLQKTSTNWTSENLQLRLEEILEDSKEFANVEVWVDESNTKKMLEEIRKASSDLDGVAKILETPDHPLVEHLLAVFEEDLGGFPYWSNSEILPEVERRSNPTTPPEPLPDY